MEKSSDLNIFMSIANPITAEVFPKLLPAPRVKSAQPPGQWAKRCNRVFRRLTALLVLATFSVNIARAVDYHVSTAQALQNALTLAASDGANNNIYITNGYYTGNFNYNSSGGYNLTVTNEPGVTNTQITLDGGGGGRALAITSSGTSAITVSGITFSRNCGSTTIGALRIAGGSLGNFGERLSVPLADQYERHGIGTRVWS